MQLLPVELRDRILWMSRPRVTCMGYAANPEKGRIFVDMELLWDEEIIDHIHKNLQWRAAVGLRGPVRVEVDVCHIYSDPVFESVIDSLLNVIPVHNVVFSYKP